MCIEACMARALRMRRKRNGVETVRKQRVPQLAKVS